LIKHRQSFFQQALRNPDTLRMTMLQHFDDAFQSISVKR